MNKVNTTRSVIGRCLHDRMMIYQSTDARLTSKKNCFLVFVLKIPKLEQILEKSSALSFYSFYFSVHYIKQIDSICRVPVQL